MLTILEMFLTYAMILVLPGLIIFGLWHRSQLVSTHVRVGVFGPGRKLNVYEVKPDLTDLQNQTVEIKGKVYTFDSSATYQRTNKWLGLLPETWQYIDYVYPHPTPRRSGAPSVDEEYLNTKRMQLIKTFTQGEDDESDSVFADKLASFAFEYQKAIVQANQAHIESSFDRQLLYKALDTSVEEKLSRVSTNAGWSEEGKLTIIVVAIIGLIVVGGGYYVYNVLSEIKNSL